MIRNKLINRKRTPPCKGGWDSNNNKYFQRKEK